MIPPHSIQAEQAVIGSLLLRPRAMADVGDVLTADDFYRADHRAIYTAIAALDESGKPVDLLAVIDYLATQGQLETAGGTEYIGKIARDAATTSPRHYAEIVKSKSVLRQLVGAALDIAEDASKSSDAAEALESAQARLMDIRADRSQGPVLVREAMSRWIAEMQRRVDNPTGLRGLATGFQDLDARTRGLTPGQLVIVAARPGMGKTTFAMNIAATASMSGIPALVFSMEMPEQELMDRAVAAQSHIPLDVIREGKLTDEQWSIANGVARKFRDARLLIDDTAGIGIAEMRARARRVQHEHGLGLIVVDYLQLIEGGNKNDNQTTRITAISRGLKLMAKQLGVPVIALSQLNRSVEHRPDKRPLMSDLRESGAIEQDADIIIFLYRDEYYRETTSSDDARRGVAEAIIAKHRNGMTGKFPLVFRGEINRFFDCGKEAADRYFSALNAGEELQQKRRSAADDL